jgi:ABC-type sugar transport system permease subunit
MITSLVIWLRKKTTIKFRIFLFTGFMICSLYLMTLGAMQQHLSSTKEEKIESLRFISNEVLASASASALWRGRKDELAELTTKLIESTDINYIAIYDSEGDLFFKYGERDFDDNAVEIRRDVEKLSVVPGFDDFDSDGVAVSTEKVKLGYLEAQIDESNVSDLAWSGLWRNFTFLVVVCLLVLPLAYILAMSLVRPLRGIVSDLQKFESGDYENLIGNSKYNDEYGAI